MKLTEEEQAILEEVECGEWKPGDGREENLAQFTAAAGATLRKDKRVNIRMSERDLRRFQRKAMEEGLPCQTLISSVLHKYINAGFPGHRT